MNILQDGLNLEKIVDGITNTTINRAKKKVYKTLQQVIEESKLVKK